MIDEDIYTYLSSAVSDPVYWGRIDSQETSNKVINFFRLSAQTDEMNPIKGIVYQISVRAPDMASASEMATNVINVLRGFSGKMGDDTYCHVVSIRELGSLYEEDGQLMHIPIQVAIQVVS